MFQPKDVSNRGKDGAPYKQGDSWSDFYIQSKLVLLALHFPKLRIIWSSSPHETVKILGDLKLNHDEPDEMTAVLKGSSGAPDEGRPTIENANAVEMLRAIPGVQGFKLKRVMEKVEGLQEFVQLEVKELHDVLGQESGNKAYGFMHRDIRGGGY
jgi:DNA excision repair protein ERCC-4